jgi:hypothetical protein
MVAAGIAFKKPDPRSETTIDVGLATLAGFLAALTVKVI